MYRDTSDAQSTSTMTFTVLVVTRPRIGPSIKWTSEIDRERKQKHTQRERQTQRKRGRQKGRQRERHTKRERDMNRYGVILCMRLIVEIHSFVCSPSVNSHCMQQYTALPCTEYWMGLGNLVMPCILLGLQTIFLEQIRTISS